MSKKSMVKAGVYSALVTVLLFSGLAVSGLIISSPQAVFSAQIPEPQCVCAGCGKKCGSGHTKNCPYRAR